MYMEMVLGFIAIIIVIVLVSEAIKAIAWGRFFCFLIFGGIALACIFSFTSEGIFVVIGAYAVLLVLAIIFGGFRKIKEECDGL